MAALNAASAVRKMTLGEEGAEIHAGILVLEMRSAGVPAG
jgi:hypothetical protein